MQLRPILSLLLLFFCINITVGSETLRWKETREFNNYVSLNKDLEILRERVITELMAPAVDVACIKHLMNTFRKDGSWPGINYEDTSRTSFEHRIHLENMVDLSNAYKKRDKIS